ncbi:pectin methylesterase CGR2 [Populus alba x Populus x berolinensis]|nr:pectin methylesterase CGR2 [Populus alba x Populus x berolinensis]
MDPRSGQNGSPALALAGFHSQNRSRSRFKRSPPLTFSIRSLRQAAFVLGYITKKCRGGQVILPDVWLMEEVFLLLGRCILNRVRRRYYPLALLSWARFFLLDTVTVAQVFGGHISNREALSKTEGGVSCTLEVQRAIPILKKAYGDSMRKVLHVGPDTCSAVSSLLKEEDTEAWGVEPYDLDDVSANCKSLVRKGLVRVADIKFPLPYRPKSFSLVIVSDALDYLSPKYLNKTLPELARVAADGLVVFSGAPGQQRVKVTELSKFGRPAKFRTSTWWIRYFVQTGLQENESALKKFEQAALKKSYKPACQVFHLQSYD